MMPKKNYDGAMSCDGRMSYDGFDGDIYPSPPLPRQPAMLRPQQGPCSSGSPAAFLIKTYTMADDPNTNHIISWSVCGTSLIIWNHIKLAEEILPKHFKHNNFSSFIYQLNNYGFRKIGLKQWEYENQWFQRGRKQLLMNIKRRDTTSRIIHRRFSRKRGMDVANDEINNTQLQNLGNHIANNKNEIQKIKGQQALLQDNIALFKEQDRVTKDNIKKIITFLAKAYGNINDKDVTQEIEKDFAREKNGENAEKGFTDYSSKDSQLNELMEVNDFITEANASRSYKDNNFWGNFLGVDAQDENESGRDFVRNQFMPNMELDDMMKSNMELIAENESKAPKMDVGEGNLHSWT